MANAIIIPVKESLSFLKLEHKKASSLFAPRVKMLIEMKKAGAAGISKRSLMELVGASSQSIHTWRTSYRKGGLNALLSHNKKGFKPSLFTEVERQKLLNLLSNPQNHITGYVELRQWVKQEFSKEVKYNSLLKYCITNFQSKVKVARKSHINKDESAVHLFKKTLATAANKPYKK